ncbi:MAG: response regulator [Pseudolabrys sp.]
MRRILVIDDKPYVRATILSVLRPAGFDVVAVDDGKIGLRKFDESTFDLAIVDLYMPGVDGVQVIKELRKRAPDFPIVAMSGVLLGPSRRTALDIIPIVPGLTEIICLKKPFRSHELLSAVESALAPVAPAPSA